MPQELRDYLSLLSPARDCLHLITTPHPQPVEGRDSLGVRVWIWGGLRGCSTSCHLVGAGSEGFPGSGGLIRQQVFLLETPGMTGQLEGQECSKSDPILIRRIDASHLASFPAPSPAYHPWKGPNETMDVKTLQKV